MAGPDIIALLVAYLSPIVTPTPVVSQVPHPRPATFVQVRQVGGTQVRPVREAPLVDAWAWAADDPAAFTLADTVRVAIHALQRTTLLGPMVYRVDEFLAPRQFDDPETGSPRRWATYQITVRSDDAIAH